jgi:hypothetical protein
LKWQSVSGDPFGLTMPVSVADDDFTLVAVPVATVGTGTHGKLWPETIKPPHVAPFMLRMK